MATTITCSLGNRSADNVTVNSVSGTDPGPYTVTLSAAVPATTKVGDTFTDSGARKYLIEGISGSDLTVYKRHFAAGADPATGAGTTQRAYAMIDDWVDAAPADLTTADQVWRGECWNDSTFTIDDNAERPNMDSTTDDTRYMILTTGSGQSFKDHADKLTNALRPNQSNGVLVHFTGGSLSTYGFNFGYAGKTIIENIQILDDSTGGIVTINNDIFPSGPIVRNCLVKSPGNSSNGCIYWRCGDIVNTGVISTAANNALHSGSTAYTKNIRNCTIIATAGTAGIGINLGDNAVVKNTAVFGFDGNNAGLVAGTVNNATDRASFGGGTSNQVNLTGYDGTEIYDATASTEDLRANSAGSLDLNGVRDQTYTNDLDIVGQTRSTTTPTIGAWEVVAGGASAVPLLMMHYNG